MKHTSKKNDKFMIEIDGNYSFIFINHLMTWPFFYLLFVSNATTFHYHSYIKTEKNRYINLHVQH